MKIGGVYILTKRSIMRMIVAISAAFALFCASAASTDGISDHVLANRYTTTINYLLTAKDTLVASSLAYTVVPEPLYLESKALYLKARRPRGAIAKPAAPPGRSYATRKTISVPLAAKITGLSESTIKRLDKDPKNTNYPGRNATAKMLAAWARLRMSDKRSVQEVRAANRPLLGRPRG